MKYSYLLFLILVNLSCNNTSGNHICSNSSQYSVNEITNNYKAFRTSPIRPSLIALLGSPKHKQIEIVNDSLVVSQYEDHLFPKYYKIDLIDSLIITGGLNKRAYIFNLKDNSIHNLKTRKITSIYPTADEILLFGYDGFHRVDKSSFKKVKGENCPIEYFRTIEPIFHEDTLFFENEWAYAITTDSWINKAPVKIKNNNENLDDKLKVEIDEIWHKNKSEYIKHNRITNTSDTFNLRIPKINKESSKYTISHDHIWIYSNRQVYLINTENKYKYYANFDYSRLIGFEIKDCNAYIVYTNKIVIKPIEEVIQKGIFFDLELHLEQVTDYDKTLATLVDNKKLTVLDALCVLDSMTYRFQHNLNEEIQNKFKSLSKDVMSMVNFEREESYIECFRNKSTPLVEQQKCLNQFMYHLGANNRFDDIRSLTDEYFTLFSIQEASNFSVQKSLNRLTEYYEKNDSIESLVLPIDEFNYQKAVLNELLCYSPWNCHGGCGGCDLSLIIQPLQKFIIDFPGSKYVEEAAWKLLCHQIEYYEDIDQYYIDLHLDFINKFPSGKHAELAKEKIKNIDQIIF